MSAPSKEWIAEFIRWIDFGEELTTEEECNQVERAFAEASKKFPLPPTARPEDDPTITERQRRHREKHAGKSR